MDERELLYWMEKIREQCGEEIMYKKVYAPFLPMIGKEDKFINKTIKEIINEAIRMLRSKKKTKNRKVKM